MAHTHVYTVTRYADHTEQTELGKEHYSVEIDAHKSMEHIATKGQWSNLEVAPWSDVDVHVRCRIICRDGWQYLMRKALRNEWASLGSDITQRQAYKDHVKRIDALTLAGDEGGLKDAFRELWTYCKEGE